MKPGDRLGEKYILERQLARSGMGDIWLAKQLGAIERPAVIKFIHPDLLSQTEARQRFFDEANIVSKLDHPNIVKFYEYDQIDDILYQVMEYIEGYSSEQIIERAREKGIQIPIDIIARIIADAASALGYIHQLRGPDGRPLELIHRDISPQNILLSKNGVLKIIDFGIVKAREKSSKTKTGIIVGKLQYMSPEQLSEEKLDHRSDIFSLGLVFYEYLTLNPFFRGKTLFEVFYEALNKPIPDITTIRYDCPTELANILYKTLARSPEERYQNAYQLQNDLESFLYHRGKPINQLNISNFLAQLFDLTTEQYTTTTAPVKNFPTNNYYPDTKDSNPSENSVDEHSLSTFFDDSIEKEFIDDDEPTAVTVNPAQFNWSGQQNYNQTENSNPFENGDSKTVISAYPPQLPGNHMADTPNYNYQKNIPASPPLPRVKDQFSTEQTHLQKASDESELEHTLSSHHLNAENNYGFSPPENKTPSTPFSYPENPESHTLQHPSPRIHRTESELNGGSHTLQRPSPKTKKDKKTHSPAQNSSSNVIISPELFAPPDNPPPQSPETVVLPESSIIPQTKDKTSPPSQSPETVVLPEKLLQNQSLNLPISQETTVLNRETLRQNTAEKEKKLSNSSRKISKPKDKTQKRKKRTKKTTQKNEKGQIIKYSLFVSIGIALGIIAFFIIYTLLSN